MVLITVISFVRTVWTNLSAVIKIGSRLCRIREGDGAFEQSYKYLQNLIADDSWKGTSPCLSIFDNRNEHFGDRSDCGSV